MFVMDIFGRAACHWPCHYHSIFQANYHMVKTLAVKNFGDFGKLQAIRQSFFHQFSQLSIELCMASYYP